MKLKKKLTAAAALLLCILMLFSCESLKSIGKKGNAETETNAVTHGKTTDVPDLSGVVAETEHYKVDVAMLTYFYYSVYNSLSQYFSVLGIDPEKDLRTQNVEAEAYEMLMGSTPEKEMTWFDFIYDEAVVEITRYIALSEKAIDAGMVLGEEDIAEIDEYIASFDSYATQNGFPDADEFLYDYYAPGVDRNVVRKCIEVQQLSYLYYQDRVNSIEATNAEIDEYFEANKADFLGVDFYYYTVELEGEYETDEEKSKASDELKAEIEAAVKNIKDESGIIAFINNYERGDGDTKDYGNDYLVTSYRKSELNEELGDWLFDAERKQWDTKVIDARDGRYSVCCLAALPYLDDSGTKNVRHILFLSENHTDAAGARKAADELYAEMQKSEITEDIFAKTANEKSEDPGSNTAGGLYENVSAGEMVAEFNDWIFDETRKPGDTGIVDTSYGSHIMYFVGSGEPAWRSEVRELITDKKADDIVKETCDAAGIVFDDSKSALIP